MAPLAPLCLVHCCASSRHEFNRHVADVAPLASEARRDLRREERAKALPESERVKTGEKSVRVVKNERIRFAENKRRVTKYAR